MAYSFRKMQLNIISIPFHTPTVVASEMSIYSHEELEQNIGQIIMVVHRVAALSSGDRQALLATLHPLFIVQLRLGQ